MGLALLAFGLRVYHLDFQSLWRDEVDALLFATRDLGSVLGSFVRVGENGPLYFLLLRFWVALTGDSEFALRFFSVVFGVLAAPLSYTVGGWLVSREAGSFAALLVAVSPYYVWYSQEAKMYTLLAFVSLLSVYLCLLALKHGQASRWAVYLLVTGLSLYVHFFALFVVLFEGVLFLWHLPGRLITALSWGIAAAVLSLLYLPLAIWQWPILVNPPPSAYPFVDLGGILSTLVFAWSINSSPIPVLFPLAFFVFLLLAGVLLFRDEPPIGVPSRTVATSRCLAQIWGALRIHRGVAVLAAYLIVPVVAFYVASLRMPLFTDRYLIIVSSAYYLLLGCGLVAVTRRSMAAAVLCLVFVVGGSVYSIWFQSHTSIKSDFRAAARYFEQRSAGIEPVIFVMPYVQNAFSYYHRGPLDSRPAPYTNGGLAPEQAGDYLARELKGQQRVWLLLSEAEGYDARGLIKEWFDQNARIQESAAFARVTLSRYDLAGITR